MRGGARVRSGPPADPDALRRTHDKLEFVQLPAAGRTAAAPPWPLSPPATRREKLLWEAEWRRPQAVAWEAIGQQTEVAIYIRTLRAAEKPGATSSLLGELRRQRDALGLTANGMKSLRWVIATGHAPAPEQEFQATGTETVAAKSRWKPEVLDGGNA